MGAPSGNTDYSFPWGPLVTFANGIQVLLASYSVILVWLNTTLNIKAFFFLHSMHDASVQLRGSGVQSFVAGVQSHAWWREGGGIWTGVEGVCGSTPWWGVWVPSRWSWMVTGWHFTSLMVLKVRNFYDLHTTGHTDSAVLLYEQSLEQLCPVASQIILYDTTFSWDNSNV